MPTEDSNHDAVTAPAGLTVRERTVAETSSSDVVPGTALARLVQATGAITVAGDYRGWTNRLKIAGTSGNEYVVSMRISDRVWGCSCPGWIFHRHCQHLDVMLPSLIAAFPGSGASPPLLRAARPPLVAVALPESADQRTRRLLALALAGPPGESQAEMQERLKEAIKRETHAGQAAMRVTHLPPVSPGPPTDAELKRRERVRRIVSGEAYRKVAPGSAKDWLSLAAAFVRGDVHFIPDARAYQPKVFAAKPKHSPVLAALFLEEMPADATALRRDYRLAVMRIFREAGFVDTAPEYVTGFARVTAAYEALKSAKRW